MSTTLGSSNRLRRPEGFNYQGSGKGGGKGGRWHRQSGYVTGVIDEDLASDNEGIPEGDDESDDALVDESTAMEHHTAFVAYQAARDRYQEALKGRGTDPELLKKRAEERLRQAKQRSYCGACKRRGHWHRDPECPLRGKAGGGDKARGSEDGGGRTQQAQMCNQVFLATNDDYRHAPDYHDILGYHDVFMANASEGTGLAGGNSVLVTNEEGGFSGKGLRQAVGDRWRLQAIVDTACTRTVAGHSWFEQYCKAMDDLQLEVTTRDETDSFKFGASRIHTSRFSVDAWFATQGKWYVVNVAIVPCTVPLLFSRPALSILGTSYDLGKHTLDLRALGLFDMPMGTGPSGHPVLQVSQFEGGSPPVDRIPSYSVAWCPSEGAYMSASSSVSIKQCEVMVAETEELSATPRPPLPFIFFPKKISPEVQNMLTEKWEQTSGGQAFLAWWKGANQSRDFWVETPNQLIRVHVVPRKHPFDPALWTTKYTRLKDTLLTRLGPSRVTDFIPCLTEGVVLHSLTDMWQEEHSIGDMQVERAHAKFVESGLWVGRSCFSKLAMAKKGLQAPPKPTRGVLMRMLRDQASGEAETVMTFGKYKSWYFREVPVAYQTWAIQEIKSGNSHPDLVRFANWARENLRDLEDKNKERMKPPKAAEDPEVMAKHPPPRALVVRRPARGQDSSSDASWAEVPSTGAQRRSFKPSARRAPAEDDEVSNMAAELPPEAARRIQDLETQLAALKQKHGIPPEHGEPRD